LFGKVGQNGIPPLKGTGIGKLGRLLGEQEKQSRTLSKRGPPFFRGANLGGTTRKPSSLDEDFYFLETNQQKPARRRLKQWQ
jgi:hypothetical protein